MECSFDSTEVVPRYIQKPVTRARAAECFAFVASIVPKITVDGTKGFAEAELWLADHR